MNYIQKTPVCHGTRVFSAAPEDAVSCSGNGSSPKMHIPIRLSNIFEPAAILAFYLFQENFSMRNICECQDNLTHLHKYTKVYSKQLTFINSYGIIFMHI